MSWLTWWIWLSGLNRTSKINVGHGSGLWLRVQAGSGLQSEARLHFWFIMKLKPLSTKTWVVWTFIISCIATSELFPLVGYPPEKQVAKVRFNFLEYQEVRRTPVGRFWLFFLFGRQRLGGCSTLGGKFRNKDSTRSQRSGSPLPEGCVSDGACWHCLNAACGVL